VDFWLGSRTFARKYGPTGVLVLAFVLGAYYVPELVRYVWDRRTLVPAYPMVAGALVLTVIISVALFALRARKRKVYGALEIGAAAFATAGAALRFVAVANDRSNALSTLLTLAAGVYFFVRGFDNYLHAEQNAGLETRAILRALLGPILLSATIFVLVVGANDHSWRPELNAETVTLMGAEGPQSPTATAYRIRDYRTRLLWLVTDPDTPQVFRSGIPQARAFCPTLHPTDGSIALARLHWRLPTADETSSLFAQFGPHAPTGDLGKAETLLLKTPRVCVDSEDWAMQTNAAAPNALAILNLDRDQDRSCFAVCVKEFEREPLY
jgi:hypothetical protein